MKLFIHGDTDKELKTLSYNDRLTGKYSSEAFSDLVGYSHYYEYRQPVDSVGIISQSNSVRYSHKQAAIDSTGRIKVLFLVTGSFLCCER